LFTYAFFNEVEVRERNACFMDQHNCTEHQSVEELNI